MDMMQYEITKILIYLGAFLGYWIGSWVMAIFYEMKLNKIKDWMTEKKQHDSYQSWKKAKRIQRLK